MINNFNLLGYKLKQFEKSSPLPPKKKQKTKQQLLNGHVIKLAKQPNS